MQSFRFGLVSALALVVAAPPVFAADDPLAAFSKDAGVVVRLKTPQKTLQKAGDLAVKVDRQQGMKVQLATPLLGVMISNPSLKGVDLDNDWWLAVYPVADGDPGLVFCIPAADADAMKESITGNYKFQTYDKWVIYTEHAGTAENIKQQLANKGASIASLQDENSTAVWKEGDLSLFINVPRLLDVYKGPFDQGVKQVNDVLEQLPAMAPPQPGVDLKTIFEMYAKGFNQLVQGVRDAKACTAGLAISGEGLALSEYVLFSEGSSTSKIIKNYEPDALKQLEQLPADQLGFAAAKLDMSALIRWGMKFSLQMYAEGDTEKERQLKELLKEYEKVKFGKFAFSFGFGNPKQGALRGAAIIESANPEAVRELSAKSSKLMSNYSVAGMKMKMTFEPKSETYGDLKADVARVKYEFDQNADPFQVEVQKKMNEMLYGPDGMVTRTFYLKDRMAQSIGGDKQGAQAVLDAIEGKNAIGGTPAFQATRNQLLPKACVIGLMDAPGLLAAAMQIAIDSGAPVPLNENDIKAIRGEPSFFGFSLSAEGNALRAKTFVPLGQMQGIGKFVRTVENAERQGL